MKWLVKIYDRALIWSQHRHAARYLAVVSFVDASVFPISPYFMLAPMSLAKPNKAMQYAFIATMSSVIGGILGYLLGYLVFNPLILPIINFMGYTEQFGLIAQRFQENEFWTTLAAGFMPIPYKLVAISAGLMHASMLTFLFASILSRGLKFFLLSWMIKVGGPKMEHLIRSSIEKFGLMLVALLLSVVLALKFFGVI